MRARQPDRAGTVVHDGVSIAYEVHGNGSPTILLLPTWMIVHARVWKMQIPYLARYFRVVAFDPPGNGRSDRPDDPLAYGTAALDDYSRAVLDATDTDDAVVVALSQGGQWALSLMANHPDRIAGAVLIAPSVPLAPPSERRQYIAEHFEEPYPPQPPSGVRRGQSDPPDNWTKYSRRYWLDELEDFGWFFFGQCLHEDHSTKQIEDCVDWTLGTTGVLLGVDHDAPSIEADTWRRWAASVQCPTMVIHGSEDRIIPLDNSRLLAQLTDATLVEFEGSGHLPLARNPVRVNLLIKEFVERLQQVPA